MALRMFDNLLSMRFHPKSTALLPTLTAGEGGFVLNMNTK